MYLIRIIQIGRRTDLNTELELRSKVRGIKKVLLEIVVALPHGGGAEEQQQRQQRQQREW
jgi:hypothetical protein